MAFPDGWLYRQKVTIQSSKVGGLLTDLPVLVTRTELHDDILDPIGSNNAQADGGDIRFTSDSAGTVQLAVEDVDFGYDSATGAGDAQIQLWVKVPSVSAVVDTDIYIWYNTAAAESQPAVTDTYGRNAVWSNGYESVHHSGELSGTLIDSTGNGYDGTFSGNLPTQVAGKIGDAQDYDGAGDYVTIAQSYGTLFDGSNDYEISAWVDLNVNNIRQTVFHPRADYDVGILYRGENGVGYTFGYYDGVSKSVDVGVNSVINTLEHVRGAWLAAGNLTLHLDNVSVGTPLVTGIPDNVNNGNYIGTQFTTSNYFNGLIDEHRVYNVVKAAEYRDAEYDNQNSPSTFLAGSIPALVTAATGIPIFRRRITARQNR